MNYPPFTKRGPGRPKGSPNKVGADIKALVIGALEKAGGMDYLLAQSKANPVAFMGLVGKVLPLQVTGVDGGPIEGRVEHVITFVNPVDVLERLD